ncbi:VWA domain-containing protein [Mycobacterium sp. BMJ-28]
MNAPDTGGPQRFRLLATFVAGRAVDIGEAAAGEAAFTTGQVIFVATDRSAADQQREILLQSALLGGGSLDSQWIKALRARPAVAQRYLALEGRRVLTDLADRLPLAADLAAGLTPAGGQDTANPRESLDRARSRARIIEPPEWFGIIKPSRLTTPKTESGTPAADNDLRLQFDPVDLADSDEDDDSETEGESKILKLFESPLFSSQSLSDYFRKVFGSSKSPGEGAAGSEMKVRSMRRARQAGPNARPLPTQIRFTDDRHPGAAIGVNGALHPEWDVHNNRYRPDWCRVIDFPLKPDPQVTAAGVPRDDVLRRRLSRIGLGPKVLRGRPDGDDLDTEALIDLFVDLRSGFSPPEHVYLEHRKIARNLGVLILVDASGSATDADTSGLAVHDHQRRAAATMAATLEELGDRVAVYGFRSQGRHAVHLMAIKTFAQRFGAVGRAGLNQLQPSGYTRLGAGIRGAGEILKTEAGTPNRLLVVLSDGFPYDDGYEGRYAEADAHKALEELRMDGVACLCLSIGAATTTEALLRVFGSAGCASAPTLSELSPQMDELFMTSLRELAAPRSR